MEPWKLRSFRVEGLAGYTSLEWSGLDPRLSVLVGQNGVGKTTVLESLLVALSFLSGRHERDALGRTFPAARYRLHLAGEESPREFSTGDVRSIEGGHRSSYNCRILHLVENRQPKNIVGRHGSHWRQNPLQRYPAALSEVKRLLSSKDPAERQLADEVLSLCKRVSGAATAAEWDWIAAEARRRGQTQLRPLSAGQFDVLALALDIASFRHNVDIGSVPHFVLIDNPDAYLHPACLESVFDLLDATLPHAQLFVATHNLKLMVSARPMRLFWLPKEARQWKEPRIVDVRALPEGMAGPFCELYGTDVGAGIVSLLTEFSESEFHSFLHRCVETCQPKQRDPGNDPQMELVRNALPQRESLTVLDVGAGHGVLVGALAEWRDGPAQITYVAQDRVILPELEAQLGRHRGAGRIADDSRVVTALSAAPREAHAIVLCNVAHNLAIPVLAEYVGVLLRDHLLHDGVSALAIVEVRTLAPEQRFVVWTWQDWREVLAPWPQLKVGHEERERDHPAKGLDATFIRWQGEGPGPTAVDLEQTLLARLPMKQDLALEEIDSVLQEQSPTPFDEVWRQRRLAFLCAHVAWMADALRRARVLDSAVAAC